MTLLTIEDVAARFDCTPRAVRNWAQSGALKAQKIAGVWIVEEDALDGFSPPKVGRPAKETMMDRTQQVDWLTELAANLVAAVPVEEDSPTRIVDYALSDEGTHTLNITWPDWFDEHDKKTLAIFVGIELSA